MNYSPLANTLTETEQAICAALPPAKTETLDLRIELGRTRLDGEEAKNLRPGSVVPLDGMSGEPLSIYAGRRLVARGEPLVIDGKIAVRLVEVAK
ncbi:MAG: FliM/FliN family flagellar motor switch protein [Pirellulales bacterium]|nr:FliM/FliN family flagellar motor switch protein [Pirellulales bacterium]